MKNKKEFSGFPFVPSLLIYFFLQLFFLYFYSNICLWFLVAHWMRWTSISTVVDVACAFTRLFVFILYQRIVIPASYFLIERAKRNIYHDGRFFLIVSFRKDRMREFYCNFYCNSTKESKNETRFEDVRCVYYGCTKI